MGFLRETAMLTMHKADARALGLVRGAKAAIRVEGREVAVRVMTSGRIAPGVARVHAGTPGLTPGRTGWHTSAVRGTEAPASAVGVTGQEG
jgi:anaerobic selenocysteine-containing dehydrogenase